MYYIKTIIYVTCSRITTIILQSYYIILLQILLEIMLTYIYNTYMLPCSDIAANIRIIYNIICSCIVVAVSVYTIYYILLNAHADQHVLHAISIILCTL